MPPKKNGEVAIKRRYMDAGQAWGWRRYLQSRAMVNHGKELGFYAKSPAKPSKDFKQGSGLLAFDWAEKGFQVAKLGRVEIRGYYRMTCRGGWCLELGYLGDSSESQKNVDRFEILLWKS